MNAGHLPTRTFYHGIDPETVPRHVACIMDGNGRWAHQRGKSRNEGHIAGERALFEGAVDGAVEIGVRWLTVYAFSTENWNRPIDEVEFLMNFNEDILDRRRQELHEKGVRIVFAGRRGWPVPDHLNVKMDEAMSLTENNDRLTLTVAFNYGGRAEIVDAVRSLLATGVKAEHVDEALIRAHLYVPDMPDVDLLIRTSNEFRVSNFLLWEIAYGELWFTETLWPDFSKEHLFEAVRDYQGRQRRFGGLGGPGDLGGLGVGSDVGLPT